MEILNFNPAATSCQVIINFGTIARSAVLTHEQWINILGFVPLTQSEVVAHLTELVNRLDSDDLWDD